jgi:AraC-like DNA-binding protein
LLSRATFLSEKMSVSRFGVGVFLHHCCSASQTNNNRRVTHALKLDYAPPPPELADYVAAFYLFESNEGSLDDIERADLGQFRLILSGEAKVVYPDGREEAYFDKTLIGPRSCATRVVARGAPMRMFGYGLNPAGWAVLSGLHADKGADKVHSAVELMGLSLDPYMAAIAACDTLGAMVDETVTRSRNFFATTKQPALWFIRATEAWLESSLVPEITELETATGLSRRQIERLAKQYFGGPPKFMIRKYRALRAANAIAQGKGDWQDYMDGTFYDQSHFIREIKEFTGMTPSAIRGSASPLSALTFARVVLDGEVSPLISAT